MPNNFMQQFQTFMQNPSQYLRQMNIPTDLKDPNEIIQYMMNNGMINQQTYNRANAMSKMFMPMFKQ